jgi:hypothetical protein
MKHLYFILIAITLPSCKAIIYTAYGIKKPTPKTEAEIRASANRHGLMADSIYSLPLENFANFTSLPTIKLFSTHGTYIPYSATEDCPAPIPAFISNLRSDSTFKQDTSRAQLPLVLSDFRNLQGESANISVAKDADFVMVVYWASFVGKRNKDAREWMQHALDNHNAKIQIINVNCDFQAWWDLDSYTKAKM